MGYKLRYVRRCTPKLRDTQLTFSTQVQTSVSGQKTLWVFTQRTFVYLAHNILNHHR